MSAVVSQQRKVVGMAGWFLQCAGLWPPLSGPHAANRCNQAGSMDAH